MNFISFIVTFGSLVLSTGLLYLTGHLFHIHWLMFHHEYTNNENGFYITIGSLTPLMIGLAISYMAEKLYIHKYKN